MAFLTDPRNDDQLLADIGSDARWVIRRPDATTVALTVVGRTVVATIKGDVVAEHVHDTLVQAATCAEKRVALLLGVPGNVLASGPPVTSEVPSFGEILASFFTAPFNTYRSDDH